MGGDHGPVGHRARGAGRLAARSRPAHRAGRPRRPDPRALARRRGRARSSASSCSEATQVVTMDEKPQDALRKKKDSSMRVAIDLVKAGEADACVSAGNTGALMATGRFVLKTIEGIDRPAIISRIRARHGHTHMLDLGANSECGRRASVPVRGDGLGRRLRPARHRQAPHRHPQHRRRGNEGRQRGAGRGAPAARQHAELRRLRRRRRHLLRRSGRGGHRRIHRQRRAEDDGRAGQHAGRRR